MFHGFLFRRQKIYIYTQKETERAMGEKANLFFLRQASNNSICMLNSIIISRDQTSLLSPCQFEVVDAAGWRESEERERERKKEGEQVVEMLAQRLNKCEKRECPLSLSLHTHIAYVNIYIKRARERERKKRPFEQIREGNGSDVIGWFSIRMLLILWKARVTQDWYWLRLFSNLNSPLP